MTHSCCICHLAKKLYYTVLYCVVLVRVRELCKKKKKKAQAENGDDDDDDDDDL